jgi:sterol desaturase/sphingolipid hydroxylase (fatty acid hydroxylase superfamily)
VLLNTVLLSLIVFVRYLCFAGGLYYLCYVWKKSSWQSKRISPFTPDNKVMKHEFKYSAISSVIFGFAGAWMLDLWEKGKTLVYLDFSKYGFCYAVFSLLLMMLVHDTYFYWTHRLLHIPWFYKRWHKVHHSAPNPSPWAAFCFHPVEAFIESLYMPIIAFTIPSHPIVIMIFLMSMTVLGVINHLGYELYPQVFHRNRFLKGIISATNHSVHHRFNKFNYALYFTWWDDLMGTSYQSDETVLRKTVGIARDSKLHDLGLTPVSEDGNPL